MKAERWIVQSLDLNQVLPELSAPEDAAGRYLQIWRKSLPLGQLWLPREILPLRPAELAREAARAVAPAVGDRLFDHGFRAPLPVRGENPARDRTADYASLANLQKPLLQLDGISTRSPLPEATVSVIVCTRGRPEDLRKCLASLVQLDPPATEILVVDNDPADVRTRAVAAEFPGVIGLAEARPGLSRARNTGIRQARGDILAWTDDDTIAHPEWIGAVRAVFSDPAISAMTGLVLAGSLETHSQVHFERDFGGFNRGFRPLTFDVRFFSEMKDLGLPVWRAGAGANMAFRRDVFGKLGGFDERLGAGAAGCSEDSEYWYRMLNAGLNIRYDPRAVVWHFHRSDHESFRGQMEEYMCGHVAALLFQYEKFRHVGNLRRLFLALPRYYWGMLTGKLQGGERGTLGREIRGCLRGILHYLTTRNQPASSDH